MKESFCESISVVFEKKNINEQWMDGLWNIYFSMDTFLTKGFGHELTGRVLLSVCTLSVLIDYAEFFTQNHRP